MKKICYDERSSWYDEEYCYINDRTFIRDLIISDDSSIMEIPCGSGKNIIWLSSCAKSVMGVDIESKMIMSVKKKIEKYKLWNVQADVGDMRILKLDCLYNLIIIPHDSLLMLQCDEDVLLTMSSLNRHLCNDGVMMIDLCNKFDYYTNREKIIKFKIDLGRIVIRKQTVYVDEMQLKIIFCYTVVYEESGEIIDEFYSNIILRKHSYELMMLSFERYGLEVVDICGDYDKSSYQSSSPRCIYLVKKRS